MKTNKSKTKASQQLALPAQGGCSEGTPSNSLELDFPRVRGTHGECGGAGNSGAAREVDVPWMRKRMLHWVTYEGEKVEGIYGKKKEKEKRNSQGKDPRTFKEPVERWRVLRNRKEKK